MSGLWFVDTNVLVYARDSSEPARQPLALEWLDHLWRERVGRISYQVLQEYYVTVTRKLSPGLPASDARDDVRALLAWRPVATDHQVLEGAWVLQDRYALSWWDAMIVSAAQTAGAAFLLTEDLQPGQRLDSVEVVSPWEVAPADLARR